MAGMRIKYQSLGVQPSEAPFDFSSSSIIHSLVQSAAVTAIWTVIVKSARLFRSEFRQLPVHETGNSHFLLKIKISHNILLRASEVETHARDPLVR